MKRLLALALILLAAACATVIRTPPSVSLAGVDLESIGLFEQRYVLQLRLRNPNDADIPIEGLSFDVEVNGMHFASGLSNAVVRVPRLGEALVEVPATSNLGAFLRQWRELRQGGRDSLDYRIKGSVRVTGYGAIPFDHKGEVPLPNLIGGEKVPDTNSRPGMI